MENLVKGEFYTATFKDGVVEYLGVYNGIISREIAHSGKFQDAHYFPERQQIRCKRNMYFPVGHFTKYEIILSEHQGST